MALNWKQYEDWLGHLLVGELPTQSRPPDATSWQRDTRTLQPGQWYVALRGENFDGHAFIPQALAKGASGILCEKVPPETPEGVAKVVVADSLAALQSIASGYRRSLPDCRVLALTGSAGKTTTKAMLFEILREAGETLNLPGSFNNEIGVPLNILATPMSAAYLPLEFGARKPHDIRFLCEIAAPDVAAVLNVGSAHLEIFGSRQALLEAKTEMFRDSPKSAALIAPQDDQRVLDKAIETGKRLLSFGFDKAASVRVAASKDDIAKTLILPLAVDGELIEVRLHHFHDSYPLNMAAAAAMATAVEIGSETIRRGLEAFRPVSGRFRTLEVSGKVLVDDSYNANPESMRSGLRSLHSLARGRKVAVILGDMLELGEDSAEAHRQLGQFVAEEIKPDLLVAVGERSKGLADGASSAGMRSVQWCADEAELARERPHLRSFAQDVIFVKASNGIGLHRLVKRYCPS